MPRLRSLDGQPAAQYAAHQPSGEVYSQTVPRSPFGQHFFVGGNVQMLGMLAELFPDRREVLSESAQRTVEGLRGAAELRVRPEIDGDTLRVRVQTVNKTGHKLPTGYPSRRMWLNFSVVDRNGRTVFESGAFDDDAGDIVGRGFPAEEHYDIITSADQVQIYEAELLDSSGEYTVSLMRAAAYLKDNRIPPEGFDPSRLERAGLGQFDLNRVGVGVDPSFLPGADEVLYEVVLDSDLVGPFQVSVRLYFQSVKIRHLEGMQSDGSAEELDFLSRFPRHNRPTMMTESIQWVAR